MSARVHVIFYSMYGHVFEMAQAVAGGARAVPGVEVKLFQVPELVPEQILVQSGAKKEREAFAHVPDLFCATAQIFLPEGAVREETGKAVMPGPGVTMPTDFPVRCDLPVPGENHTYVLYGSGGCSLFDANKLRHLEGLGEFHY